MRNAREPQTPVYTSEQREGKRRENGASEAADTELLMS